MRIGIAGLVLASAAWLGTANAQDSRGAIIGRVVDPSGARVAGARISAVNVETNTTSSSVTNPDGNYEIGYLLPGAYRVSAEMAGFQKSVRESVELRVGDRLELNFQLTVGALSESIVVTGETPLLETSSASIGMVMDQARTTQLPVVGGSAFYLSRLAPGIVNTAGRSAGNPSDYSSVGGSVNGSRGSTSEISLDGVPDMYGRSSAFVPPQDLVQEYRIETAKYDASLGHSAGAVVNVSMQTGTNQLHGTAYLFDSRIRAVPWFSNNWLYDPTTGPITPEKRSLAEPGWLHQRWGATARGPAVIPGLYDGRNRTFWSFGYEGLYIQRQPTNKFTIPTVAERSGDFSELLKLGSQYQVYDPFTIAAAPNNRFSRQPLPGNVIPASRLDPVGTRIIKYFPAPNAPGTSDGRQNLFTVSMEQKWFASEVGRLDHNFTDRHRAFVRVNENHYLHDTQNIPTIAVGDRDRQWGWGGAFDDVYVFNPNLLLNVRYGVTTQKPTLRRFSQGFDLLSLGWPQSLLDEIRSKNNPAGIAFPQIAIDGYAQLGAGGGNDHSNIYQSWGGTLTRLSGNHSFRLGGDFRVLRENVYTFGAVAPNLSFSNSYTKGPLDSSPGAPIGQALASFLFGIPTGGNVAINASQAEQSTFTAVFLQDDWKLSPRLTLNLGIRYEYEGATTERYNRTLRGYDFATPNPISDVARANYARSPIPELPVDRFKTIGGLTFAGVNGQPRGTWEPDGNNFAPRVGLAYQLDRHTAIRAGYGIFFDQTGIDRRDINQGGFNQTTNFQATVDTGLHWIAGLSNPFPGGFLLPSGSSAGLRTNLGRGITFFNPHTLNPYIQRWSLALQRQLPQQIVVQASYVGSRANKLGVSHDIDYVPGSWLSTSPVRDQATIDFLTAQVASPFNGIDEFAGTSLGNVRIGRQNLLKPYPQFGSMTVNDSIGWSYYHSLQVQAERRFRDGITFQLSYTWSKNMDATGFLNDSDARLEKVISDLDVPHRFVLSAIWELPFGKGRLLARDARGLLNHAIGGWQLQGWYEGQTGQSLGFGNAIFTGNLHNIPLPKDQRSISEWFNVDAGFERDNTKQLSSNIRTLSSRFNDVRSDGINNFDMSLFKNFRVSERLKLQFRIESYNALNHVQFANPNTSPTSSAFGTITGERGHGQRQVTFALKLLF